MDDIVTIADAISSKLGMSPADFIQALFAEEYLSDGPFAEYALAVAWRGRRQRLKRFLKFLLSRLKDASEVIFRGSGLPTWMAPDQLMLPVARLACGTPVDLPRLRAEMTLGRALYKELVEGSIPARRVLVPVFRHELSALFGPEPISGKLTVAEREELTQEITENLVPYQRILPAIVEPNADSLPVGLGRYLKRYSTVLLLDDQVLARQLNGSAAWLVYDRLQNPEVGPYIDSELRRFRQLVGFVHHDLSSESIRREFAKILDGRCEHRT